MKLRELTIEQRRIAVDTAQLYEHLLELQAERQGLRGGLHWKKVAGRDYLVRTIDRHGGNRSLGPRSPKTEEAYREFTETKRDLDERIRSINQEVARQARFCVAAGVNRVPRIAADIVRSLDAGGLLGSHLIILGSHAIYAYEMAAGVQLKAGLLQTEDLDTLLNTKAEIELVGSVRSSGLLGILQRVDRTFKPQRKRSFRAVNAKGFMVDLIRAPIDSPGGLTSIGSGPDLIAEPLHGLEWLGAAPRMTQIVIADNGFPVRFVVPEPRVFALHKLWVSLQPTRDPIKRKRDFRQAEAVAQLSLEYFNLRFDGPAIKALPAALTAMIPGLVERLRERSSKTRGEPTALPPGFEDPDGDPDAD
ncbi:GSU2403 family nucleotidyltransferase fold protein [Candidatus Binatus sp.]|uniref:GSU2403 family nucleotidyltransferase fold protein n=1 Tax=Candidatus Binatus sp. TaxID=2811406 RepID=UPI003C4A1737